MPRPVRPAAPASPRPSTRRQGPHRIPARSDERTALSALTDGQMGRSPAHTDLLHTGDDTIGGCVRHLQRRRPALWLLWRRRLLEEETQCARDGGERRQLRELKRRLHGGPRRQGGQGGADHCGGRGWAVPGLHAPAAQAHVPAHTIEAGSSSLGGSVLASYRRSIQKADRRMPAGRSIHAHLDGRS